MQKEIDFVITWVSERDAHWRQKKEMYGHFTNSALLTADDRPERYRDWGLLRYLFRSIACCAPWVHRVYLITDESIPIQGWLNTSCDRLQVVPYTELLPQENLPTFNSNAIEVNLHRIHGLSEQFVYFNDDMFLIRPVQPENFFINGLPVDMLALQPVIANPSNPVMSRILLNDSLVISRHFRKWETMRAHPAAYFHPGYPPVYLTYNLLERAFPQYTGFYTVHGPSPLMKHTFEEIWQLEPEVLAATSARKIRSGEDVTQYLFREWQKQKGMFVPRNILRDFGYFELGDPVNRLAAYMLGGRKKILCVNDTSREIRNEDRLRWQLHALFHRLFPEKCFFER